MTKHPSFQCPFYYGLISNLYAYVSGNPINYTDPLGLECRLYSSPAFGQAFGNHAWLYSTETKEMVGRGGKSGSGNDRNGGDINDPYIVIRDKKGMTDAQFIRALLNTTEFNKGWFVPFTNIENAAGRILFSDCHGDMQRAFKDLGVKYPGAPNGRINEKALQELIVGSIPKVWDVPMF